jgi:hypothetical protein
MPSTDEDKFNELLSMIHELCQSRDDWKELDRIAREHAKYGANDTERYDCECPSCFLHNDYKIAIQQLEYAHADEKLQWEYNMDKIKKVCKEALAELEVFNYAHYESLEKELSNVIIALSKIR